MCIRCPPRWPVLKSGTLSKTWFLHCIVSTVRVWFPAGTPSHTASTTRSETFLRAVHENYITNWILRPNLHCCHQHVSYVCHTCMCAHYYHLGHLPARCLSYILYIIYILYIMLYILYYVTHPIATNSCKTDSTAAHLTNSSPHDPVWASFYWVCNWEKRAAALWPMGLGSI